MQTLGRPSVESRRIRRAIVVMTILAVLIIITFIVSMNTGFIRLSPSEVLRTMVGLGTERQWMILFDFRLPRILIALMIGAGLAVSGCVIQGVYRNPLADPGLLGIQAGAGLAVTMFTLFSTSSSVLSIFMLPLLALVGAGLAAVLIYMLAYKRNEGVSPTSLVLTGLAVGAGIQAVMIVLSLRINTEQYHNVLAWIEGNIGGISWRFVLTLLPWIVILIPYVMYRSTVLNILSLSDQSAVGLGAPVQKERRLLLIAAVALAGSCVAVGGGINFVGLLGPHLARVLVGPKHQLLLPTSAFIGALLTLVADTIGRTILMPVMEVPTGIVVAVIGAPYFLYLLARTKA
ncbi:FecCD family ABC transporter permease [Paenibacillus xylaniclasticus]|uniref:FecCD family ABC transporter permease n=1 Tax=Paenibacillus xylaniclasticus TaxID=588083 RepID=UPI000FD965BB|nr:MULTISPECIES: iron ABC transporter permease [Paenibacillus]GFN30838.1 iron ABC transporter permease [Paenibacillus curdlanolyticus]